MQHLIRGMAEVDKSADGAMVPRFVGFPDNRDFFYLMRRGGPAMTMRDALVVARASCCWPARSRQPARFEEQNELLLRQLQEVHGLSDQQMASDPRDLRQLRRASARATRRSSSIR